jgi:hypothetical protein
MFETICFEHWDMWFETPAPAVFNMFYATCDECAWCNIHQTLYHYKRNKRFVTNIERHIELKIVKLKELGRPPKRFVMSNITVFAIPE